MSKDKNKKQSTIQRKKHDRKFLVLGNELCQREDISYAALGLLVSLLSRPDDWQVILTQLERKGSRRDKIASMIKELRTLGYITKGEQVRILGKFSSAQYFVSEEPLPSTDLPLTVPPSAVLPSTLEPQQQRTYLLPDTKDIPTPHPNKETTTTKTGSLSFDILGSVEHTKWCLLKGHERVDLVCEHANIKAKDSPNGWAVTALREDWHLSEIEEPENEGKFMLDNLGYDTWEESNTFSLWRMQLRGSGLSDVEQDDYMYLFPEDRFLYDNDGVDNPYSDLTADDLRKKIIDLQEMIESGKV